MPAPTLEEQAASIVTESFKDGEPSDGAQTAEEQAAHDAEAARAAEAAAKDDGDAAEGAEKVAKTDDAGDGAAAEGDKSGDKGAKDDAAAAAGAEAKSKGKDPSKRIGDLTANWRTAQRDADAQRSRADKAEAELAALKKGDTKTLTSPSATDNGGVVPPDPSQFEYGELDPKYIAALARHEAKQALAAEKAEEKTARQAEAADAQRREQAEKQDKLVRAGMELHDDFDEVVMQGAREGKWDLSPALGELILDSEHGPAIAYELASNPTEATRVSKLSPAEQAKYLGRQEAKFEAAKPSQDGKTPPKAPQAPPPPKTPRGNSGQFRVGADSTDFAAVERAYAAGELR